MPDERFFKKAPSISLSDLCMHIGIDCVELSGNLILDGVAGLADAGPTDVSFLENKKYLSVLPETKAGVVVMESQYVDRLPDHVHPIVTDTPYRIFALISQYFYPSEKMEPGIDMSASLHPTAQIAEGCQIEAGAFIGKNVSVGQDCYIGANAVVDHGVQINERSRIGAGAYLGYCLVGANANIHPGVRIGTRGFGFAMDQQGHIDVPQLGRVLIGDNVEIGANTTIDRGMGPDTVIGDGTKIDNLVQIGHNVQIGKGCVIVAMTGIAGSTVLEDYVVCAAKVGIAGHLTIGKGAQIAARSGVMKNVDPGAKVGGLPAVPLNQWMRERVFINKLMRKKDKNHG